MWTEIHDNKPTKYGVIDKRLWHYDNLHMFDIRLNHFRQKMENMDNHNKRRLDAMEKTKTIMLKTMCNLVKQDYN